MREPAWRKTGSIPDYRFSLANETTFLAWIRTSLALIVGALGIDQLLPDIAPAPADRLVRCPGVHRRRPRHRGLPPLGAMEACATTASCRSPA